MHVIAKEKVQRIINKIKNNNFDELDVDSLFINLREYSKGFPIFREVGDLIAHDKRDRGVVNKSLESLYLNIRFKSKYNSRLDISRPFPFWVKKLILSNVEKSNESILILKYRVSKKVLEDHIKKSFKYDKKTKMTVLKGEISPVILKALTYVTGTLFNKVRFTQDQLMNEVVEVIKVNDLSINNDFMNQSNYFTLCILLLFHHRTFDFGGHRPGYCFIRPEVKSEEGDIEKLVGKLEVHGAIWLKRERGDASINFTLMSTNLDIEEWCDENMFYYVPLNKYSPNLLKKRIKLNHNLSISDSRKLINIMT